MDSSQLVDNMERMSRGPHAGHRRSSARGACFTGVFTPTGHAAPLTVAAHLQGPPVPVTVRFSNSEGDPATPDAHPVTRGMATRFHLPGGDTDLLAITVPRFVASTPQEFLDLTAAIATADPSAIESFLGAHPHLAEAVTQRPPVPASYATTAYWAIHAFIWVGESGGRRPIRYRWEPEAGREELADPSQPFDYLTTELHQRLPVAFSLRVQLAEPGDPTHDATIAWPAEREEITAGRLVVTAPVDEQAAFSPMNLTQGIEPSDDPLLAARTHAYAESLRRRTSES